MCKTEAMATAADPIPLNPDHIPANLFVTSYFYCVDSIKHEEQILYNVKKVIKLAYYNADANNLPSAMHLKAGKLT